jgi:hypothetical protein
VERAALCRGALALALVGAQGCAFHYMENAKIDPVSERVVARTRTIDGTLFRISSTAVAVGPSTISAPERQPLQRPDEDDEKVSEQFEALVALLERQGEERKARARGEELEPLPLPLLPHRPTVYTTIASGELSYYVDDREASEDLGKMVRTGVMAYFWVSLIGGASEGASVLWDYLSSP